jgi:hypothetical protein
MESKQSVNRPLNHPGDEELAAFGDPALGPDALERLAIHLDCCPTCQARLERMEPALSQFSRCLDLVHSQVPWERNAEFEIPNVTQVDVTQVNERQETGAKRPRFTAWPWVWAGGIAAVATVCVVVFSWIGRTADQRAEALLAQASALPSHKTPSHRLRVRTQTALYVRGVPEEKEIPLVRARFDEANYDWRDPLSAQSYSAWRRTLKRKTSKVSATEGQPQQRIETSTDEGTLRIASLTFDEKLAPVSGLFQFSDREWVEITAMPDVDPTPDLVPAPVPAPSAAGTSENVPREPLAERELDVRLAINVLHTGASEPIEVSTSSGDILVTTYHLTSDQERKLAVSLKEISGVTLRALDGNGDANAEQKQARSSDRTEMLLETSQDVSFEAHSLAELADRFQPTVEAALSETAKRKLWNLRLSHVREMNRDLTKLEQRLREASTVFRLAPADAASEPEALPQNLASSASAVDRLIITLYAADDSKSAHATIWPQIVSEFARLRSFARDYSHSIEEGRRARE